MIRPLPVAPALGALASGSRARGPGVGTITKLGTAAAVGPEERRRHLRVSITLEVTVRYAGRAVQVRTRDLSVSGLCLEGDLGLAQGDTVEIDLRLPGNRELLHLPAVVRWVDKGRVAGVQFSAPRAIHVWAIQRFLATAERG